jgi:pimeloyl-ACP methyl ester carboxylesterase
LALGIRLARRGGLLAHLGVVRLGAACFRAGCRWVPRAISRAASPPRLAVMDRIAGAVGRMPPEVWPVVAAHWSNPKSFAGIASHLEALPASARQMREAGPVRGIPATVLTAASTPALPEEELLSLAPEARHIVAGGSGHWIHLDRPDLVVDAVREAVETARNTVRG